MKQQKKRHHSSSFGQRTWTAGVAAAACLAVYCLTWHQQHSKHAALGTVEEQPVPWACLPESRPKLADYSRAALSAAAAWSSSVPFNASAPIPIQLWQTSSSQELGMRAGMLRLIWQATNPSLPMHFMDDQQAAAFILSSYGQEVLDVYVAFPLGVMRADFWRYAVLYMHGGIYADVDTKCLMPVERWFPPRQPLPGDPVFVDDTPGWQAAGPLQYHELSWSDCGLVASVEESGVNMVQWIIASVPGHPVLEAALRIALHRVQWGFDCTHDCIVPHHTGPALWTQAFREVLGLPGNVSAAAIATAAWTDPAVYQTVRSLRICIVAFTFWGAPYSSAAQNADNHFSSVWTDDQPNPGWLQARARLQAAAGAHAVVNDDVQSPAFKSEPNC